MRPLQYVGEPDLTGPADIPDSLAEATSVPTTSPSLFDASVHAAASILRERILVAFTLAHNHPGIAGVAEGSGCLRCNAEKALDELARRSVRHA